LFFKRLLDLEKSVLNEMDLLNKELDCSYSRLINGIEITAVVRGDGGLKNFRATKKEK
jgi:hypothetical protein